MANVYVYDGGSLCLRRCKKGTALAKYKTKQVIQKVNQITHLYFLKKSMCFLRTLKTIENCSLEIQLLISIRRQCSHLHSINFPDKSQVKSIMIPLRLLSKSEFKNSFWGKWLENNVNTIAKLYNSGW